MNRPYNNPVENRTGVTLVEMLVVVALMMFLISIAAPMLKVNNDEKQSRETARSLQGYLQEARTKAMTTGRPCGVALLPFENYPTACVKAQLVETPPLYAGDTYDSTVTVSGNGNSPTLSFSNCSNNWLVDGNRIRFSSRGAWYILKGNTCILPASYDGPDANYRPWTNGKWKTSYEIQAVPVAKAKNYLDSVGMAQPMLVPRGAAIDLVYSGCGDSGQIDNKNTNPVLIMFAPTGEVSQFTYGGNVDDDCAPPSDKIYLLVGQWVRSLGKDFSLPGDGLYNYQNYDNYWVIIDPRTGTTHVEQIINGDKGGTVENSRKFE